MRRMYLMHLYETNVFTVAPQTCQHFDSLALPHAIPPLVLPRCGLCGFGAAPRLKQSCRLVRTAREEKTAPGKPFGSLLPAAGRFCSLPGATVDSGGIVLHWLGEEEEEPELAAGCSCCRAWSSASPSRRVGEAARENGIALIPAAPQVSPGCRRRGGSRAGRKRAGEAGKDVASGCAYAFWVAGGWG